MQDSLEDYLRISKNKKKEAHPKVSPQILITAQRKKECELRAIKIVEFLIEGKLRKEVFFECLKHIDPSYYQDVVEERAITKLCGYCLCNKQIPDMPKQQYHISTKTNKVYDITDRKNYCSNICYKSSVHIKAQIETSPLWLRKPEEAPRFSLLPACDRGIPGEEIDQGIVKSVKDEIAFTPVSLFTEASLDEVISDEIKNIKKKQRSINQTQNSMAAFAEVDEESKQETKEQPSTNDKQKETPEVCSKNKEKVKLSESEEQFVKAREEKTSNFVDTVTSNSNASKQVKSKEIKTKRIIKKAAPVDVLGQIQKHVTEWITLETFIFLHGEDRVKEILNENTLSDYFDKLKVADLQASQQIRYMNICRKLKLKEIADEKFDKSVNEGKLQPVPDYKQLKEESKNMDLKVRSFYTGKLHEQEDMNFPTDGKKEENEDEPEPVLPLVEVNSQNVMRKKIYLESVNRTLQKLLPILDLNDVEIFGDIQTLVKTFNLQAHNTVFKPLIWTVITVILLEILSVKNRSLQRRLDCKQNQDYIKLLLKPFPNCDNFIENILSIFNNIEEFVERYVTSD